MPRKRRPIDRTQGALRDTSLVVIATEDRYAVRQYFEFFQSTRIQFHVLSTEDGRSSSEHVVDRLDGYMKEYEIGEDDQFWLVCDTDHRIKPSHVKNLVEVIRQCKKKNIGVALSNPCFELWLLLHFADFPSETSLKCGDVERMIRASAGEYNKTKVYNLPITHELVRDAIAKSKSNQPDSGDIPNSTQTNVHLIIEDLIARGMISVPESE